VSAFGLNPLGSGEGQIVHSTSNKALERTEVGIWLWHFNFKKALSAFLPSPGSGLDDGRYAHQLWLHGLLPSDLAGKHAALEDWGNGVARIQGMRGWRNNEELARSPMNSMSPSIIALTASSVNKQKAKEARYWVNPKSCPARPGMRRAKISAP